MSELGGEKIDIIEWSPDPKRFIEEALSPAKIISIAIDENEKKAIVKVSEDQQSLAIGKGGQNVRLSAKLTGWRIDIQSTKGEDLGGAGEKTEDVQPIEAGTETGTGEDNEAATKQTETTSE